MDKRLVIDMKIVFCLLVFIVVSCTLRNEKREADYLLRELEDKLMDSNDSLAYLLWNEINDTLVLSMTEEQRAQYAVLSNQVFDRMDMKYDEELLKEAISFYEHSDCDDYYRGLVYYYYGHVLRQQNEMYSLECYDMALEYFRQCGNLRYEFLCHNYMGCVYEKNYAMKNAIRKYKEAIDVCKKYKNEDYKNCMIASLFRCYVSCYVFAGDTMSLQKVFALTDSVRKIKDFNPIDETIYYQNMFLMAKSRSQYELAFGYADTLMYLCDKYDESRLWVDIGMASIYIEQGKPDDAYELIKLYEIDSIDDIMKKIPVLDCLSYVYEEKQMLDSALWCKKQMGYLLDSLERVKADVELMVLSNRSRENLISQTNGKMLVNVIVCLLFLLVVVCGVMKYSKVKMKIKYIEQTYEDKIQELKQRIHDISEVNIMQKNIDDVNVIYGVLGEIVMLSQYQDIEPGKRMEQVCHLFERIFPNAIARMISTFSLSKEESVCLYLWLAGLSYSKIALVINATKTTAYNRIDECCKRIQVRKDKESVLRVLYPVMIG